MNGNRITAALARLLAFALALMAGAAAHAQLPPDGRPAIAAALVAETSAPSRGGTVQLAITMQPQPGWHGYWLNPGEAGVPPRIEWTLPDGVAAGPLRFPTPKPLIVGGIMNYVFEGPYAHLLTVTVPAGLSGTIPLRAHFEWLACTDEVCVPEEGDLALDLPVGDGAADAARLAEFDGYRAALPLPLDGAGTAAVENGRLRLAFPLPGVDAAGAYFFPAEDERLTYSAPQTASRAGDLLLLETAAAGAAQPVSGVLRLADGRGFAVRAAPGAVPRADSGGGSSGGGVLATTALAFLGAVLGGLLLNVMPCVFPILSLKALSLARAGGDGRSARTEALGYTAGAVAMAALLGGVLLALRAGGEAAGWAFQLQNPFVVFALLLLTVAITLNLAGLFELPTIGGRFGGEGSSGWRGAFATGALATFVATPCTGPFMGAALGALLVLPPLAAMAIFVGLGLGLALPFLLLGFVPALRRRLPKPGPWLDRFRRVLSLPMAATTVALAWILGRQTGVDGMALGLAAAVLLGVALWAWGARQRAGGRARWTAWVPAAAAVALAAVLPAGGSAPATAAASPLAAQPFSEARLSELREGGKPVFVYFTADWCVSCKVNEKAAIDRVEVGNAFARAGVATLVGDWTNADPAIGRFLAAQGRTGVPLYLFYRPGVPAPEVLPQLLTPGRLTSLVE